MKILFFYKNIAAAFLVSVTVILFSGCSPTFQSFGEFSVKEIGEGIHEIRDGDGSIFVLVQRGKKAPAGYNKNRIIQVPVKRVIAYSTYNIAMLKVLGVLDDTLVGVTSEYKDWVMPEVREGFEAGRITYVGEAGAVDYEQIKEISPELVLTWDRAAIPMLNELEIPAIITTSGTAMNLDTRLGFTRFLAYLFNREKEADAFIARVNKTVDRISAITASVSQRPKVIWGDIYEKRVLIEPGNSWVAEIIRHAGGEYIFDDVSGAA